MSSAAHHQFNIDGTPMDRKVKLFAQVDGGEPKPFISVRHLLQWLNESGTDIRLSKADVYRKLSDHQPTKKLDKRWPPSLIVSRQPLLSV